MRKFSLLFLSSLYICGIYYAKLEDMNGFILKKLVEVASVEGENDYIHLRWFEHGDCAI